VIVTAEAQMERLMLAEHSFPEIIKTFLTAHTMRASRNEVIQQKLPSNNKDQANLFNRQEGF
jgi:hypothetical protein